MKMTFNWGHGIALFYIVFTGIIVSVLIASFDVDHSLVVEDYYAQDLAYQSTFDKKLNDITNDQLKVSVENKQVHLEFLNEKNIKGEILFYRASDKSQDFSQTIDSNSEVISMDKKPSGKWSVKIDWTENNLPFYREEIIYL